MMNLNQIINRISHICLEGIHIWCFHHVSGSYEPTYMCPGDWMSADDFKKEVLSLMHMGVKFISLSDAYSMLKNDFIRLKKYAVITFDDGNSSLKEILPWLISNQIPVTLFINGKYLDGKSFRYCSLEKYLTRNELFELTSSFIEVGHHGWEHNDCANMTAEEFIFSIENNIKALSNHPRYVPFWAYTWGAHNNSTDEILKRYNLIPVLMDGVKNYNDIYLHRELISNK